MARIPDTYAGTSVAGAGYALNTLVSAAIGGALPYIAKINYGTNKPCHLNHALRTSVDSQTLSDSALELGFSVYH